MDIQLIIEDTTVTCICQKDINLYTEKNIRDEIMYNLPDNYENFIIDMKDISYIDSAGIGLLVYYYNYMNRKGKYFAIKNVQKPILKILKRNKIDNLLTILE